MNCERVKELLFEYINDELCESDAKKIRDHIMICDECKNEYEMLLGMSYAVKESRYEAPEELHGRVMTAVKVDKARKKRAKIIRRLGYVAASAAAFVIAVNAMLNLGIFNKSQAPDVEINGVHDGNKNESANDDQVIDLNADTVFVSIGSESYGGSDILLSEGTIKYFVGEWGCDLDEGWRVELQVSEDGSVVVYIEDRFGLGNYYDGSLTFENGQIYLDQSDGNKVCHAVVQMAIKDGKLLMDVVKGDTPWIEVT